MVHNPYLLRDLPLLPDRILVQTQKAYRQVFSEFERAARPAVSPKGPARHVEQLRTALGQIEHELHARGIGTRPWWADSEASV